MQSSRAAPRLVAGTCCLAAITAELVVGLYVRPVLSARYVLSLCTAKVLLWSAASSRVDICVLADLDRPRTLLRLRFPYSV